MMCEAGFSVCVVGGLVYNVCSGFSVFIHHDVCSGFRGEKCIGCLVYDVCMGFRGEKCIGGLGVRSVCSDSCKTTHRHY